MQNLQLSQAKAVFFAIIYKMMLVKLKGRQTLGYVVVTDFKDGKISTMYYSTGYIDVQTTKKTNVSGFKRRAGMW